MTEVLHPALELSAQEICGPVRIGIKESHKYSQSSATHLLRRKAEGVEAVYHGEAFPCLEGGCKKGSLFKKANDDRTRGNSFKLKVSGFRHAYIFHS